MTSASITLPDWIHEIVNWEKIYATPEERMSLAIELSSQNIEHQTGGPFAAAIFDEKGKLISVGVNRVIPENASFAHGEMTAILFAQKKLGTYDLSTENRKLTIATSSEPCGMCLNGIFWSGIRNVEAGARGEDVENIGFDEGFKPADWIAALKSKGITATRDILRQKAIPILQKYALENKIYNTSSMQNEKQ